MLRSTSIACILSLLMLNRGIGQAAHPTENAETYIDVRSSGAVGDGVRDDTAALATAAKSCSAKGGVLYLPHTHAAYTTSRTFELPANCDLEIDGTLKATAPMEAVVTVGADGTAYRHRIFGVGTIDSANLAKRHISMANYGHFEVTGITLLNGASIAGIDIGPDGAKGGYEAYIHDINLFVPTGVASVPGNAGIWAHKGTDSSVYNIAIVGWDTGVRNNIHNNQPFANIHVWGFGPNPGWKGISNLPSVCFDDVAGDAQWTGDECDTPTKIGLRAHGYNDQITGFSCFNNDTWGTDDVVNCIQFDLPKPFSSVMNSIFQGRKGHRLASDVAVAGDNYSQLTLLGNFTIVGVVKSSSMTPHLSNVTVEDTLNVGGPLDYFGQGKMMFGSGASGGYQFNVAGAPVAEITRSGMDLSQGASYRISGAVVLPAWLDAYAGGANDKSVQLASGTGAANHLPAYDATGGLADSGKVLAGSGEFVPAVANSMGCLDGWDHLPCTVAKLPPTTMTSTTSTPPTTVFTTAAQTGVYQVTVTFHSLGGASSGTAAPVAVLGQINAIGATASITSTGADGVSTASITLDEGPGVALGYGLNVSKVAGAARYVVSMEVVRLQ
jgi:Pectate lyase superfamily protein